MCRVWEDSYAPGMVQIRPTRDDIVRAFRRQVLANGGTWDRRGSALVESADELCLTPALTRRLDVGEDLILALPVDLVACAYGHDCITLF